MYESQGQPVKQSEFSQTGEISQNAHPDTFHLPRINEEFQDYHLTLDSGSDQHHKPKKTNISHLKTEGKEDALITHNRSYYYEHSNNISVLMKNRKKLAKTKRAPENVAILNQYPKLAQFVENSVLNSSQQEALHQIIMKKPVLAASLDLYACTNQGANAVPAKKNAFKLTKISDQQMRLKAQKNLEKNEQEKIKLLKEIKKIRKAKQLLEQQRDTTLSIEKNHFIQPSRHQANATLNANNQNSGSNTNGSSSSNNKATDSGCSNAPNLAIATANGPIGSNQGVISNNGSGLQNCSSSGGNQQLPGSKNGNCNVKNVPANGSNNTQGLSTQVQTLSPAKREGPSHSREPLIQTRRLEAAIQNSCKNKQKLNSIVAGKNQSAQPAQPSNGSHANNYSLRHFSPMLIQIKVAPIPTNPREASMVYRYCVGSGNNPEVVQRVMSKRDNWKEVPVFSNQIHFKWAPWSRAIK